jgi:hypothetical protein
VELDFTFTMPKGLFFILLHLQLIIIRRSGDHVAQVAACIAYTQCTLPMFLLDLWTFLIPCLLMTRALVISPFTTTMWMLCLSHLLSKISA